MRARPLHNLSVMTESRRSYRPPPSAEETSERQALVVRRGLPREDRDLFASRAEESVAPPPSIRTGERSENSVLFSVDVLRQAASSVPPPPPAVQSRPQDDDGAGTIDLNALAQATGGSLAYKPLTLSEPPMAAFAHDVGGPITSHGRSSGGSRTWMYVAGGAVAAFAVLGGVAVAAMAGSDGDKATATHAADASRGVGLEAAFAPVRSGAQAAAPASDAPDHTSAKIASGRGGKGGATFASSYRPSSTPSRSTPAPAAKSGGAKSGGGADRCGCHGVLSCVIRCSATGK